MSKYDFVGETELLIDFEHSTPAVRCVVKAGSDCNAVVSAIEAGMRELFAKHCLFVDYGLNRPLVQLVREPTSVVSLEEDEASWNSLLHSIGKTFQEANDARVASFADNPDNGKVGWWSVEGVRHDGFVRASSEREAVEKAISDGVVGDWESPTARFVGENPETLG